MNFQEDFFPDYGTYMHIKRKEIANEILEFYENTGKLNFNEILNNYYNLTDYDINEIKRLTYSYLGRG